MESVIAHDPLTTIDSSFYNGGLLFSTGLLSGIAMISLYAFLLLVETRNKVNTSV